MTSQKRCQSNTNAKYPAIISKEIPKLILLKALDGIVLGVGTHLGAYFLKFKFLSIIYSQAIRNKTPDPIAIPNIKIIMKIFIYYLLLNRNVY